MPQHPKVSVVIAAYNAVHFLPRAVASVFSQEGVSVEVVLVDDGSRDGTAQLMIDLAASDPRVRSVVLPHNRGPAAARNAGVDVASGDWVAVLDADDAFAEGRLASLLELADSSGADVVTDAFCYYDAATGVVSPSPFLRRDARVLDVHAFLSAARPLRPEPDYGLLKPVINRDFLRRSGVHYRDDSRHGEDFLLVVDLLLAGAAYVMSPLHGYLYTTRASGWSRTAVDYGAVVRSSLELREVEGIRGDPVARRLLEERVRALEEHTVLEEWRRRIELRDLPGAVRHGLRHPTLLRDAAKRLRRRVMRASERLR
jgi:succinoglycan biosynthesis protein ExoO